MRQGIPLVHKLLLRTTGAELYVWLLKKKQKNKQKNPTRTENGGLRRKTWTYYRHKC